MKDGSAQMRVKFDNFYNTRYVTSSATSVEA